MNKNTEEKFVSMKTVLTMLVLSLIVSLAYTFGKSIFGSDMTPTSVIGSFVVIFIAQLIFHLFIHLDNKKKK